ncbi:MAG: hypothetical protein HYX74_02030 [Acidobacteria bacterium]|nr:hypothetical protein [Acidobacteriota bacterium]
MPRSRSILLLGALAAFCIQAAAGQRVTRWVLQGAGWIPVEGSRTPGARFNSDKITIEVELPGSQYGVPSAVFSIRNRSGADIVLKVERIYLKDPAAPPAPAEPAESAGGAEPAEGESSGEPAVMASYSFSYGATVAAGASKGGNIHLSRIWFKGYGNEQSVQLRMEGVEIDGQEVQVPPLTITRLETGIDVGGRGR